MGKVQLQNIVNNLENLEIFEALLKKERQKEYESYFQYLEKKQGKLNINISYRY